MNQILFIAKNHLNINNKVYLKRIIFFRFVFVISVILFLLFIFLLFFINYSYTEQEKFSSKIIDNYNITKLYSNNQNNSYNYLLYNNNKILGFIKIPKLNIYYPVFANISNELLRISPCRFAGPLPNDTGNLCIAGHNYNNNKFFSKINTLRENDTIFIYDTFGNSNIYYVYDNYEVNFKDLSPITNTNSVDKELTLITCNNYNSNRIIIKAKIVD